MDRPIELIPLVCTKCSTPVPAEASEVAWACNQCGQGLLLDVRTGLTPVEIFYSAAIPANLRGKPYWVAEGRLSLSRQSYGSGEKQERESATFWSQPRRFFVPAFAATLESLLNQAASLLLNPPPLNPGPATRFEPVTLSLEDVQSAADFIVVAIEANRKDKLKKLAFKLELSPPVLWILP